MANSHGFQVARATAATSVAGVVKLGRSVRTASARSATVFLRDVGQGLLEVSHNTLALFGLLIAGVVLFAASRADIRHEAEVRALGWLQARHEARGDRMFHDLRHRRACVVAVDERVFGPRGHNPHRRREVRQHLRIGRDEKVVRSCAHREVVDVSRARGRTKDGDACKGQRGENRKNRTHRRLVSQSGRVQDRTDEDTLRGSRVWARTP